MSPAVLKSLPSVNIKYHPTLYWSSMIFGSKTKLGQLVIISKLSMKKGSLVKTCENLWIHSYSRIRRITYFLAVQCHSFLCKSYKMSTFYCLQTAKRQLPEIYLSLTSLTTFPSISEKLTHNILGTFMHIIHLLGIYSLGVS